MNFLLEYWDALFPLVQFGARILDIILVAAIVLWLYRLTKGTQAIPVFMGLLAIYLIWKVVSLAGLPVLAELLGQFIGGRNYCCHHSLPTRTTSISILNRR